MFVDATALVAEVLAAATLHMVTPFAAFDPEFTVRALLEFLARYEVEENGVQLHIVVARLVLLAGDAFVEKHAAVQTVVLGAEWALELFALFTPCLV